ncbi:hypothetical protein JGH11_16965 [Dysgonomonas sp. Marseille-P4677]|uniref:hypothetical protein n=1 Tax=Dysgonomonas sp. Marseille-P4677 TaxID=2364790 RepID=UPI00191454E5|nr:hypothetical protein [Dysgonomonas sp. Marseille-P4677]MBK5722567.1 hypothetical protein [Dysgonomonas sp. Marseille-P4677]
MTLEEFKQAASELDEELTSIVSKKLTEFSKKYKIIPLEINIKVTHGSQSIRTEEENPERFHFTHARAVSKYRF